MAEDRDDSQEKTQDPRGKPPVHPRTAPNGFRRCCAKLRYRKLEIEIESKIERGMLTPRRGGGFSI